MGTAEERTQLTGTKETTTTVTKAFLNLTVCILASALLSIPFGFDKTGWLGGIILLFLVGALVDYTLLCLGETCIKLNVYDYQEIAEISFGKPGRFIQATVQLALSLSLMISYQRIAADNIQGMLKPEWVASASSWDIPIDMFLILLVTTIIIVPLSSLATLKMLSYSSTVSIVSICVLCGSLFYFDVQRSPANSVEMISSEIYIGLSVFATGFVCHQLITPTLNCLPGNLIERKQNFHRVVHLSIGTSFCFFFAVGLMGYYLCHDTTEQRTCPGNILNWTIPHGPHFSNRPLGKVSMLMFLVTTLVAYPLEHYSCFNTICKLIYGEWGTPPLCIAITIKLLTIGITTGPALFIKDVGPLVAWTGNLAAFPLGFILPLSLALKNRNNGQNPTTIQETIFRAILLGLSCLLMLVQTLGSILEAPVF